MPPRKGSKAKKLEKENHKQTIQNLESEVLALKARDQDQKLTIENLQAEILTLKAQKQPTIDKNNLFYLLEKYQRIKDNQERSRASLPSGVIVGRPPHLREHFQEQDGLVAKHFFVPRSEFGHSKDVPLFPKTAEEELEELSAVHRVWLQVKERFEELTKAKERFVAYQAAKNDPENSARWKTVFSKQPILGQKRIRDEDEEKDDET